MEFYIALNAKMAVETVDNNLAYKIGELDSLCTAEKLFKGVFERIYTWLIVY